MWFSSTPNSISEILPANSLPFISSLVWLFGFWAFDIFHNWPPSLPTYKVDVWVWNGDTVKAVILEPKFSIK